MNKTIETMTEKDALELIDALEEYFYYRIQNPGGVPFSGIMELHGAMRAASCQWRTLSQCCNQ